MSGTVISNVVLGIVTLGAVAFYVLVFRPALKEKHWGAEKAGGVKPSVPHAAEMTTTTNP